MTGRTLRRAAALLGAAAAIALAAPATASAQPDTTPAAQPDRPVETYATCVNSRRAGDLLLLVDESGSLKSTDPDGARVTAADILLGHLAQQAQRQGIAIDVQVAGFATTFDAAPTPWTTLDPGTLPTLTGAVNAFRTRNTGRDTDYWTALEGARRSLADHAQATAAGQPGGRCQAIAWFSDGRLDIEPRPATGDRPRTVPYVDGQIGDDAAASAAERAAADSLCRPGGLADAIRSSHVVTFAIGLAPPGTPPGEFDLMRSIATGEPYQGRACGAVTDPTPGSFQLASDLDALLFAFDDVFGAPDIPTSPTAICAPADTTCRGHEFVLDESIDGVRILGQAEDVASVTAELVGPDGVAHPLSVRDRGVTTPLAFGPVTGTYSWATDRTVDIDVSNSGGAAAGWAGVWSLRFVDPTATTSTGTSKTKIRIWGNVVPVWTNRVEAAPSGSTVPDVRFGLAKANGGPVAPESLRGTFELSADLVDPDGTVQPVVGALDKESIARPATIDLTRMSPGAATLRLTLDLTTAPAQRPGTGQTVPGTTLTPQTVDLPLRVDSALGYPTVAGRIDFGSVEGTAELTTALTATGPGCVWVAPDAPLVLTTTPDRVSSVQITADGATSAPSCLRLADGQGGQVTLHLRTDRPGNGTAGGTLPVTIAPLDRPDQARTVDVPFTGDLRTPLNPVNFWATLVAALLLGPGIPLALLYLVKWATARIPARGLYTQVIPVTVEGGRLLRDGAPFGFRDGDLTALADIPPRGARRLDLGEVVLRTRTGTSPFGTGHVSATPVATGPVGRGIVCASSTDPRPHGRRGTARLPLAVHGTWVLLHDQAGPPDAARLLVLVGAETSAEQRRAFATEIADRAPGVLDRLRAGRKPPTGPPPDRGVAAEAPRFGPTPVFGTPPGGTPTYGPAPVYGPRSRSDDGPGREPPPYGRRP